MEQTPTPFDPDRFAKQMASDDALRGLLIAGIVGALVATLLLPGVTWLSSFVAPAVLLGLSVFVTPALGQVLEEIFAIAIGFYCCNNRAICIS